MIVHNSSSNLIGSELNQNSKETFEFGKYSTFDDTPKNLLVLGDRTTGTIVLCHEDHYLSKKKENNRGEN